MQGRFYARADRRLEQRSFGGILHPIKPPRLRRGDCVGVISPSWGGAGAYPNRLERGVEEIHRLGFRTKIGAHALNSHGFVSDTPENRASDVHDMFANPEVRAILSTIGGDHSCHLLPHLDFELIRRNPKIFMGFSDITVLNVAIWQQTGLVTFNGPAVLTDFAEYPRTLEYTESHFLRTVMEPSPIGTLDPSPWWTDEFLDWGPKEDVERPREGFTSPGWTWLKPGEATGVLVGGCLESLQHLRGTRYWPDFGGRILFIETSELAPDPATVDGMLMDYANMGVLQEIAGLLVGRPTRYTEAQRRELREILLERTAKYRFPIVADMDFGHTAPQLTLPIGCEARIDGTARSFEILEAAVLQGTENQATGYVAATGLPE